MGGENEIIPYAEERGDNAHTMTFFLSTEGEYQDLYSMDSDCVEVALFTYDGILYLYTFSNEDLHLEPVLSPPSNGLCWSLSAEQSVTTTASKPLSNSFSSPFTKASGFSSFAKSNIGNWTSTQYGLSTVPDNNKPTTHVNLGLNIDIMKEIGNSTEPHSIPVDNGNVEDHHEELNRDDPLILKNASQKKEKSSVPAPTFSSFTTFGKKEEKKSFVPDIDFSKPAPAPAFSSFTPTFGKKEEKKDEKKSSVPDLDFSKPAPTPAFSSFTPTFGKKNEKKDEKKDEKKEEKKEKSTLAPTLNSRPSSSSLDKKEKTTFISSLPSSPSSLNKEEENNDEITFDKYGIEEVESSDTDSFHFPSQQISQPLYNEADLQQYNDHIAQLHTKRDALLAKCMLFFSLLIL